MFDQSFCTFKAESCFSFYLELPTSLINRYIRYYRFDFKKVNKEKVTRRFNCLHRAEIEHFGLLHSRSYFPSYHWQ